MPPDRAKKYEYGFIKYNTEEIMATLLLKRQIADRFNILSESIERIEVIEIAIKLNNFENSFDPKR
tara:strand:- start:1043 stop:1240 length:198 start_codon:yes stop_codon:yes gene_type:complete